MQAVDLFLVDQLHLLGSPELDGHILEVVVSRMRYIASAVGRAIRIVGLAASMANARDVGEWIGASKVGLEFSCCVVFGLLLFFTRTFLQTHTFNFHPTVRPVTLEMHLQGFDNAQFGPRLLAMSRPLTQLVQRTPLDKPIVVFVHAKSHALIVARDLKVMCDGLDDPSGRFRIASRTDLEALVTPVIKSSVQRAYLLDYGIAILHEHMTEEEHDLVEKLYTNELIR